MGTTANLALRYPELADLPDVPRDIKNLANDSDSAIMARIVRLGNVTGLYNVDTLGRKRCWIFARLVGDATIALANLSAGAEVKFFATQDATGERVLTVTDNVVSAEVPIELGPTASSVATLLTGDGSDLFITGPDANRPLVVLAADHTLVEVDAGSRLAARAVGPVGLTVPLNSEEAFEVGTEVELLTVGAGEFRVNAHRGVRIRQRGVYRAIAENGAGTLTKTDTNEWLLDGELSALDEFDLTTLPAIAAHFDSTQVEAAIGDSLAVVADLSGNGNDAAQGTGGMQPVLEIGENGFPVIRFSGAQRLDVVGVDATVAARTIFCVAVRLAGAGNAAIWDLRDLKSVLRDNAGWIYGEDQASAVVDLPGAGIDLSVVTIRFNGTGSADAFVNDNAPVNFDPHDEYQSVPGSTLALGAKASGSEWWNGHLCQLIVCDDDVVDATLANAQAALMAKWGIA